MKLKLSALLLAFAGLASANSGDTTRYDTTAYGRDTCCGGKVGQYTQVKIHAGSGLFIDSARAAKISDSAKALVAYSRDTAYLLVGPTRKYTTIDAAVVAGALRNTPLIIDLDPKGTYTTAGGNFPAIPMVIYGNGALVTLTNPVRVNASWRAYDLSVTGNVCFNGASTDRYYLTGGVTTGTDTLNAGYLHYEERSLTGGTLIQNGGTVKIIGTSVSSTIQHKAGSLQIAYSNFTGTQAGALVTSTASVSTDNFRILGGSFTNNGAGSAIDISGNSVATIGANSFIGANFKTASAASVIGGTALADVASCRTSFAPTGTGFNYASWPWDVQGYVTTVSSATPIVLTNASPYQQYITGSTAQTITLPVTSTLILGEGWFIQNNSTATITVNSSGANAVILIPAGTSSYVSCILLSGTTAASWSTTANATAVASGKKLSVSNTVTLAGTDGTTLTFPSTSASVARTDAAQTFVGGQTAPAFAQTVQTVAVSTTPAVNLASGNTVVLGTAGTPGALTAASNVTFTSMTVGSTTSLTFIQFSTSVAVSFTATGYTFYQPGKTAGVASGSPVLLAADMTLSCIYNAQITWLSATTALVELLKS